VTWIWYGGVLIALGGLLALIGRVRGDLKRRAVRRRPARGGAERRRDPDARVPVGLVVLDAGCSALFAYQLRSPRTNSCTAR
jgi:hypothetical protein